VHVRVEHQKEREEAKQETRRGEYHGLARGPPPLIGRSAWEPCTAPDGPSRSPVTRPGGRSPTTYVLRRSVMLRPRLVAVAEPLRRLDDPHATFPNRTIALPVRRRQFLGHVIATLAGAREMISTLRTGAAKARVAARARDDACRQRRGSGLARAGRDGGGDREGVIRYKRLLDRRSRERHGILVDAVGCSRVVRSQRPTEQDEGAQEKPASPDQELLHVEPAAAR